MNIRILIMEFLSVLVFKIAPKNSEYGARMRNCLWWYVMNQDPGLPPYCVDGWVIHHGGYDEFDLSDHNESLPPHQKGVSESHELP